MQRLQIRKEQLTFWREENWFWGQKHGYEIDDLKNNFRLEVFDRESKVSGFVWLSWIHVIFFSNSCWSNRIQALCYRLCLYQERSSKLKVRRTLLTNHCKVIMWEHLRIVHKETHNPPIILVTASQFFKLSKLILICKLNFTVGKIWISKVVFFCLTYNAESKSMSFLS